MARLYALLVGINDYDVVPALSGCVADVERMESWLRETWPAADLAIETLKNEDATRAAVGEQMRRHLGRAGTGDVALFHYCGHGARARSAPEFSAFFTGGRDEGLVCIDSRREGGLDLADKELAVLIAEIAARDPHLAVLLDCCNSGSGTRDADQYRDFVPRTVAEHPAGRPLESYAGGWYAAQMARGEGLHIPEGKHILLAACDRMQTAKELTGHGGVFTTSLLKALRACPPDVAYPELFMRTRAATRGLVSAQDPQFETIGGFDAWSAFLGRGARKARPLYFVGRGADGWSVDCGAIHGLPTDVDAPVTFALFDATDGEREIGTATARTVGAQRSDLDLGFQPADDATTLRAALTSLPAPAMLVGFEGDAALRAQIETALAAPSPDPVAIADLPLDAAHRLVVAGNVVELRQQGSGLLIQAVRTGPDPGWVTPLIGVLRHVARWERSWRLANARPRLDPEALSFWYEERRPEGVVPHRDGQATLRIVDGREVRGQLKFANRTGQELHVALFYHSGQYGIHSLPTAGVVAAGGEVVLWGDNPESDFFFLAGNEAQATERFKLIVSTERLDDFLLTQEPLELGATTGATRAVGNFHKRERPISNDWVAKDMTFQLRQGLASMGAADVPLVGGRLLVKAHPTLRAALSLAPIVTDTRSVGSEAMARGLAAQGLQPLELGGTGGEAGSVLELSGIERPDQLRDAPVEIVIDTPMAPGETLIALSFDGPVPLLFSAGPLDDGRQLVRIDAAPTLGETRDLGTSLKLFLFKTVLRRGDVNRLGIVGTGPDGKVRLDTSGIATAVAGARDILVLLPGILGDATSLAGGVTAAGLAARHDLVLGFDFENLNTPIEDTARSLKAQLATAGVDFAGPARLTLLGHGIGGLVARWLVEQEGAAGAVAHMILCGVPNLGSPLGDVDKARQLLGTIIGAAPKFLPAVAPYVAPILFALQQSKKLTATLEQLQPGSPLLTILARSADPGVRTTLLAGDVAAYREPGDGDWYRDMLLRAARGLPFELLFGGQPHDVLTGVNSAFGLPARTPPAVRIDVACHHLNFFASPAGRAALGGIAPA